MSLREIMAAIRRRRQEPPLPAPAEAQADLVDVFKDERRMELKREGDGRTPEGSYTVDARNPQSAFDARAW
jgi:murein L,D-transpeptidase YafK